MIGRSPYAQVRDYRLLISQLLTRNTPVFLGNHDKSLDFRKFTSGVVVFPDYETASGDRIEFTNNCDLWLKVVRYKELAETICQFGSGRNICLSENEIILVIEKVLALKPAQMVGNFPMLPKNIAGNIHPSIAIVPQLSGVVINKPVEILEEYQTIHSIWFSDLDNIKKIEQFHTLLTSIIWRKIKETYKETAVKSTFSGIENLLRGESELLKHTHALRRLGNSLKGKDAKVTENDVNEGFKTLCLLVNKLYDQKIPEILAAECEKIIYRETAGYGLRETLPSAMHVEVKHIDAENCELTLIDPEASEDELFKISYKNAQWFKDLHTYISLSDILCLVKPYYHEGSLKASEIVLEPDYLLSPQKIGAALEFEKPEIYFWLSLFEDKVSKQNKMPSSKSLMTLAQYSLRGDYTNHCLASYCAGDDALPDDRLQAFIKSNRVDMTAFMSMESFNEGASGFTV